MRFELAFQARKFARMETVRTRMVHCAVETRYWCLASWSWIPCWTVILPLPRRFAYHTVRRTRQAGR